MGYFRDPGILSKWQKYLNYLKLKGEVLMQLEKLVVALRGEPREFKCNKEELRLKHPPCPPGQHLA